MAMTSKYSNIKVLDLKLLDEKEFKKLANDVFHYANQKAIRLEKQKLNLYSNAYVQMQPNDGSLLRFRMGSNRFRTLLNIKKAIRFIASRTSNIKEVKKDKGRYQSEFGTDDLEYIRKFYDTFRYLRSSEFGGRDYLVVFGSSNMYEWLKLNFTMSHRLSWYEDRMRAMVDDWLKAVNEQDEVFRVVR